MYEMLRAFVFCHIERSRNMNKKHSFQRQKTNGFAPACRNIETAECR